MPNTARVHQATKQAEGQTAPSTARNQNTSYNPGTFGETLKAPGRSTTPVGQLQAALGAEFAAAPDEERWPLRWTVAMVFSACGAFWTSVYLLVAALIG